MTTKEPWSKELRAKIQELLETYFFTPLLDATKETTLDNAVPKTLAQHIKSGLVWYDGLYFRGKKSAALSKELRALGAVFSTSEKAWRLPENRMPQDLRNTIAERRKQAVALQKHFSEVITRLQKQMLFTAPKLNFDVEAAKTDRSLQREMQRKVPASVSIQPVLNDEQKAHMAEDYTENVQLSIPGFIDAEVERFRKQVLPQIQKGMDRRDLAKYVQDRLGVGKERAKFIARQETALFTSKLREVQYRKAGIEKYRWSAIGGRRGDGRTRDAHMDASGKEFFWDHSKNRNPVRNSEGRPVHPGEDFNCFVGDTSIELIGDIVRAYKRRYEGAIVRFKSNTGRWTSVTPNHPILTTRGWVAAKHLNEGDELIQCFNSDVINVSRSEINYRHPTASEVYDFFAVSNSFERSCGGYQQFHGDGIGHQKVNVVTVESELRNERDTVGNKEVGNYIVASPDVTHAFLASLGDFSSFFDGALTTFGCEVCGLDLLASPLGAHARPLSFLRLALRSGSNATLFQSKINASSCDSIAFRKFIDAYSLPIEGTDFVRRKVFAVVGYQSFFESVMISEIKHETFSGDVFNFETTENLYTANGVVASNCRCIAIPIVEKIL